MIRADHGHAGKLALGAGHRRQAHARHAGHVLQHFLQLEQAGEVPLTGFGRRARMARQELPQHRQAVACPRVVFHGAGAQRVELRVDREVLLRQPGVVAHRVQLGDLRQQRRVAAQQLDGRAGARAGAAAYWRLPRPGLDSSKISIARYRDVCQRLRPR